MWHLRARPDRRRHECAVAGLAARVLDEAPFALTFDDACYYRGDRRNLVDGHGVDLRPDQPDQRLPPALAGIGMLAPPRRPRRRPAAMRAQLAIAARLLGRRPSSWSCARSDGPHPSWPPVVVLVAGNPFVLRCVGSGLESGLVVLVGALLLTRAADLDLADRGPVGPSTGSAPPGSGLPRPGPTRPC